MKKIFKYKVPFKGIGDEKCVVAMHGDSTIFSVKIMECGICVWALADPAAELEDREFRIFGTGFEVPINLLMVFDFIDTLIEQREATYVWHIFAKKRGRSIENPGGI